jgi:hypothetical protein
VSAGTASVPAYEAYLEGLAYGVRSVQTGDNQLFLKGRMALERAQSLDPEFAAAHWELAQFWQSQMQVTSIGSELTSETAEERKAQYKVAIGKAIATEKDTVLRTRYRAHEAAADLRLTEALNLITAYLSERPNDYQALDDQLTLLMFLRRWDKAHPVAHRLADIAGEDSISMQSAVQQLVFMNDGAGAARVARRALELHPDNAMVQYQAHRALLWNGAIDEAREVLRPIMASQLGWFNKNLASLRQACADSDFDEALRIHARFIDEYQEGETILWISHQVLGQREQASAVLMPYDDANQIYSLSSYLTYPYFDPRPYPNLMEWVEQQDIAQPPLIDIPYACNMPMGSAA